VHKFKEMILHQKRPLIYNLKIHNES